MFSIIIPTCNRNDLLSQCLDCLLPTVQTITEQYEIIVTDDSREKIAKGLVTDKYPMARWVEGPNRGPAANRNSGAKKAAGDWLIFIDDDCLPDKDILNQYKYGIGQNPAAFAFEGAILPDDPELLKNEMAECPVNTQGNCFWSANICVQKKLFIEIGGFDELFVLAALEDQDLFERLKKHTNVPFLENCVVVHPVRVGSNRKRFSRLKIEFAGWIYYLKKHNDVNVKWLLLRGAKDYMKMSIKNLLKLQFKLLPLNILKSFYCFYLFITVK